MDHRTPEAISAAGLKKRPYTVEDDDSSCTLTRFDQCVICALVLCIFATFPLVAVMA